MFMPKIPLSSIRAALIRVFSCRVMKFLVQNIERQSSVFGQCSADRGIRVNTILSPAFIMFFGGIENVDL